MFLLAFLRGYVKINLVYQRPERFLNLLASNGIPVHNAVKQGVSGAGITVASRDADRVLELARECGCRAEIIRIGGMAAVRETFRTRPLLFISTAAAMILLVVMSQRLIAIRVSAADSADELRVYELLDEAGIK